LNQRSPILFFDVLALLGRYNDRNRGFRPLKVARMVRESNSVVSVVLEPADGPPLPGRFVVLRLSPRAHALPVLRSYSLSDLPDPGRYRITIKQEPHGIASTYVSTQLRTGDTFPARSTKYLPQCHRKRCATNHGNSLPARATTQNCDAWRFQSTLTRNDPLRQDHAHTRPDPLLKIVPGLTSSYPSAPLLLRSLRPSARGKWPSPKCHSHRAQ